MSKYVTGRDGNPVLDGFGNPVLNPSFDDPKFHSDSSSDNKSSRSTNTTTSANVGLTIERNTDGTATINFADGGQHTVSGGDGVKALQQAYGDRVKNIVSSGKTATEQKTLRDATYGEAEAAAAQANRIAVIEAMDEATPVINLTSQQVQQIIATNGQADRPLNDTTNKIALKNAILGMSMGLSFEDAIDMSADGGFYTMLREGYADPNWSGTNANHPRVDQLNSMGGKLKDCHITNVWWNYCSMGNT
jgi:hypothetical protein